MPAGVGGFLRPSHRAHGQVGRILDALATGGHAGDTIVVYTSDHGDIMGSHQLVAKTVMYEEAVRVPMLLRVPWLSEGQRRIAAPVSQVDLAPTLLDLLGMPVPSHLEGQSWRPALTSGSSLSEGDVVIEWNGPGTGALGGRARELPPHLASMATYQDAWRSVTAQVRTIITPTGWKFNCSPIGEHELFNLTEDPGETENLFEHESVRELVADLYTRLLHWQKQTGDEARLAADPRLP